MQLAELDCDFLCGGAVSRATLTGEGQLKTARGHLGLHHQHLGSLHLVVSSYPQIVWSVAKVITGFVYHDIGLICHLADVLLSAYSIGYGRVPTTPSFGYSVLGRNHGSQVLPSSVNPAPLFLLAATKSLY